MRSRLLAPLVVVALAALFLAPAIFSSRTVYLGDLTAFERPRDRLVASEGVPSWTPDIYGGVSTLGAQEMALLYLPNTLVACVAPGRAAAIGLFLHLVLAALGARALARQLGASEEAALLAAIVYGSGGAILSMHQVAVYVRSAAFLPWVLVGAARRSVVLAALALTGMYLGGDPLGCAAAALAAVALGGDALTVAKAAPLAMLVGAAQLLPALAVLGDTSRAQGYSWDVAMRWSLWPPELGGLVVPFLFGSHASPESVWIDAVTPDHERAWCEALYVGPIAAALAVVGAAQPGRARRVGLALLGFLVLAIGRFGPLGRLLFALPLGFRYPAKLVSPAMLGVAVLAARGLDALPKKRLAIGLGALGGVLLVATNLVTMGAFEIDTSAALYVEGAKALAALAPRLAHAAFFAFGAAALVAKGRRVRLGLVLLVALDLAFALRPAILTAPISLLDASPPAVDALRSIEASEGGVPARFWPTPAARRPTQSEQQRAAESGCLPSELAAGLDPDTGLGRGARSQAGFLSNEPLRPLVLAVKTAHLVETGKIAPDRAYALRGARFVLAAKGEKVAGEVARDLGERVLLRLRGAPPWAAVFPRVRLVSGTQGALDALGASDVPLIDGTGPTFDGEPRPARLASRFESSRFELDAEGPGWLVVRESFAKGWTATIDGEPAAIVPADIAFRAVLLPAGKKRVVFEYHAPGAKLGVVLSLLGVAVLVLTASGRLRSRRALAAPSRASSRPGAA